MLLLQLAAGCGDPAYADPDRNRDLLGEDDTATVAGDTGDTGDSAVTWADVTGTLVFEDFQTGNPFANVEVSYEDDEWTSGEDGAVELTVAGGTTSLLPADHLSCTPTVISLTTDDATGWSAPIPYSFADPLTTVLSTGGATWDTSKGILSVTILEDTGTEKVALDRTTLELSASYDVAIAARDGGYLASTEVGEDSNGVVMFVNVPAGPATVTLDTPGSYTCVAFPSSANEDLTFTVTEGVVTVATVVCTRG